MNTGDSPFNLYNYFLGDEPLTELTSRPALEFRDKQFSYHQLKFETNFWVKEIASRGIQTGDRVALLLYDSPEFIAAFLATATIGAIAVPINTFLTREEIRFIITDSGAKLVIAEADLAEKNGLNELEQGEIFIVNNQARPAFDSSKQLAAEFEIANTERQTPAFILYTSGSTGTPKGALHGHGNIAYTVETYAKKVLQLNSDDKVFSASRLFFAYGLGNSLSFPLAAKATVILESERPTPQAIARIFREQKPTIFFGVPAVYRALLDLHLGGERVDPSSLRLCISAGEALPAQIFEEWHREMGFEILDGIGSTEMLHIFISNREDQVRAGSTGKLVDGYAAKLLDDAGKEIVGEGTGNLFVKGASRMLGYWQRDELTANVLQDGWVKTGDVYQRDLQDGFYHIGRSDDCFKVKGLWVSPVEVESVLLAHAKVAEAAVVASTDKDGLATAKAFLVIRIEEGIDAIKNDIYEFAKSKLALYKVPTQYAIIKEMPRTSTGKVQRFKLRS